MIHSLRQAWYETSLREAYLPDLEIRVKQHPADGRLQALLGGRRALAGDYAGAATALENAANDGEQKGALWLAWSACAAAAGDRAKSGAILRLGLNNPNAAPDIQAALDRCRALDASATPSALADAISPQGPASLVSDYTQGSRLNGLAEWWGHHHPATSGYATRRHWAQEQPTNAFVQRLWAEALLRNRELPAAETAANKAVELAPNTPENHLVLGDVLRQRGAATKAGLEYTATLKLKPDWLPALIGLGNVAVEKKLIPIGVEMFEKAVKQDPHSADAWIGMGRAYYNERLKLDRCLEAFQKAAQLAPRRTDFFADYSNALRVNYKNAEAEALLRRRLAAEPNDAQAYYLLALVLLDHNATPARQDEAERNLQTSLHLVPKVAAVEARLGRLLLERGKPREARPFLEQALEDDPYNATAMQNLARAYRATGETKAADYVQGQAKSLTDYIQKINFLEDQIQRQPQNSDLYLQLAKHYASGGQKEKAQREYELAFLLQTHRNEAVRGIEAIRAGTSTVKALPQR